MKRKLLFTIVLCLFAGLTVTNIGLARTPDNSDFTLDHISVMAKAYDEGGGGTIYWCWTNLSLGGILYLRACAAHDPYSIPSYKCGAYVYGVKKTFTSEYKQCYE